MFDIFSSQLLTFQNIMLYYKTVLREIFTLY